VGALLAAELNEREAKRIPRAGDRRRQGWRFVDADDHHPRENVLKMRRGEALTDADRAPWLLSLHEVLHSELRGGSSGSSVVLACSALKRSYRSLLRDGRPPPQPPPPPSPDSGEGNGGSHPPLHIQFVCLNPPRGEMERRVRMREGHFMPASLVASQVEALELGDDLAAVIGGEGEHRPQSPEETVRRVVDAIHPW